MRLSKVAMDLLAQGKCAEIQQLPVNELLDHDTIPSKAELCAMRRPVLVSSGRIYPQSQVKNMFATIWAPLCPETNMPLDKGFVIPLYQITIDMAWSKFEEASVIAQNVFEEMTVTVGRGKVRIIVTGSDKGLAALLGHVFADFRNNLAVLASEYYSASSCSFAWHVKSESTKLEFWLPKAANRAAIVSELIDAILKPLNLRDAFVPSTRDDVREVFSGAVSYEKIAECCSNFIERGLVYRQQFVDSSFEDAVNSALPPKQVMQQVGMGKRSFAVFRPVQQNGAPLVAQQPSASQVTEPFAPQSPGMQQFGLGKVTRS
jgi:hypothetical protein